MQEAAGGCTPCRSYTGGCGGHRQGQRRAGASSGCLRRSRLPSWRWTLREGFGAKDATRRIPGSESPLPPGRPGALSTYRDSRSRFPPLVPHEPRELLLKRQLQGRPSCVREEVNVVATSRCAEPGGRSGGWRRLPRLPRRRLVREPPRNSGCFTVPERRDVMRFGRRRRGCRVMGSPSSDRRMEVGPNVRPLTRW